MDPALVRDAVLSWIGAVSHPPTLNAWADAIRTRLAALGHRPDCRLADTNDLTETTGLRIRVGTEVFRVVRIEVFHGGRAGSERIKIEAERLAI